MIHGKVTVTKIYKDGYSEVHIEESNASVRGLGFLWTAIMMGEPVNRENIHFRYFQLGTGANIIPPLVAVDDPVGLWGLNTPLTKAEYGTQPTIKIEKFFPVSGNPQFANITDTVLSTSEALYFGDITGDYITSITPNSIHHKILLDETVANGITISEIGLFAKDPLYRGGRDEPVMVAYKQLKYSGDGIEIQGGPIEKNNEFSVVIDWEITLGDVNDPTLSS